MLADRMMFAAFSGEHMSLYLALNCSFMHINDVSITSGGVGAVYIAFESNPFEDPYPVLEQHFSTCMTGIDLYTGGFLLNMSHPEWPIWIVHRTNISLPTQRAPTRRRLGGDVH